MFLSTRGCAEHMTQLPRLKVKVTCQGHVIYPSIRVRSIPPESFERFSLNFTQMFLSVRRCAEHMTQLLRLKVTGQGQGIYPWISCPLHISWTLWTLFIKLHPNVPLSEVVCRTNDSATQTQGQGHTSRSWNLPLNFVSFKSPQPFVRFSLNITQFFLSVSWCAEPMTRLCKLKVKVDHISMSCDSDAGDMAVLQTAVLNEVGIPNLVCGYIFGFWSVTYCFRVTVTLTSGLSTRRIVPGAYLLYCFR